MKSEIGFFRISYRRLCMGDGRYYTYYQFFDVLFSAIVVIYSVFSVVYCYYRKNRESDITNIYISFICILVFAVLRVIESVIPNLAICLKLRNLQIAAIYALINLIIVFLERL